MINGKYKNHKLLEPKKDININSVVSPNNKDFSSKIGIIGLIGKN